jgi:protein-tyrosine kinase
MVNTRTLEQLISDREVGPVRTLARVGPVRNGVVIANRKFGSLAVPDLSEQEILENWLVLSEATPAPPSRHAVSMAVLGSNDQVVAAFDVLRTRLLQAMKANNWRTIGVLSPTRGCGASFVAAGIASSCSRLTGSRTVLLDLDLRSPSIHSAFQVEAPGPIAGFLEGTTPLESHLVRLDGCFALGMNSDVSTDPSGVLQHRNIVESLGDLREALDPDIIICDLPPVLTSDAAMAFLPQLDGVLLVVDGTQTKATEVSECERLFKDKTQLLGVILNKGEDAGFRRYGKD